MPCLEGIHGSKRHAFALEKTFSFSAYPAVGRTPASFPLTTTDEIAAGLFAYVRVLAALECGWAGKKA